MGCTWYPLPYPLWTCYQTLDHMSWNSVDPFPLTYLRYPILLNDPSANAIRASTRYARVQNRPRVNARLAVVSSEKAFHFLRPFSITDEQASHMCASLRVKSGYCNAIHIHESIHTYIYWSLRLSHWIYVHPFSVRMPPPSPHFWYINVYNYVWTCSTFTSAESSGRPTTKVYFFGKLESSGWNFFLVSD